MKKLVEFADGINLKHMVKVLSDNTETGRVLLEIEGVGTQEINIVSSKSNLQGLIRWAICPECKKRIKKLYFSEDSNIFVCRVCSGLGYKTQYDRAFRKTSYERKHISPIEKRKMTRGEMLKRLSNLLKQKQGNAV